MPVGRPRANPLALAVLCCLYERPMHPYEVATTLRTRAKHEAVRLNYGSLYTVVESLEKRGLIEARETLRAGRRPERTVYAITDAGSRELTEWLADLLGTPEKEYLRFEAGLSFVAALPPDEVVALLRDRATALQVEIARQGAGIASARGLGVPRVFVLETEYVLRLAEAELAFVQSIVEDIEAGCLDGLEPWRAFHGPGAEGAST